MNDCDDRRPTTGDAFHTSPLCVVRRLTVRLGTQSVLLSVEFLEATEPLQKEADRNPEHVRTAVRHAKTAGAAAWTFHARQVFSLTTTCLRARIQADTVERAAGLTCAATGVTCMGTRTAGTVVTLAAAREPDKVFTGWGNACTGTTPCTVTADAARLVVATFSPTPHLHTAYYHLDAYGSVRAVTDEAGAVLRRHDYFPFGEEYLPQPGADTRRFTGNDRDAQTGLDHFEARAYSSRTGRFTTVDPALDAEEALVDPQRWNRYAYARNNPARYIDPDGPNPLVIMAMGRNGRTLIPPRK